MTTVEIQYGYVTPPSEQVAIALARAREVYGIRRLSFDHNARTLRVEYDATRLNAAAVTKLVHEAGLQIAPDVADAPPLIPAPEPEKAPAPAA
jgi:hypothetical protein